MKTGFKDRLEVYLKEKKAKSPWNFDAPQYDERTSCFVSAGTNYGEGRRQPLGTVRHSSEGGVPRGRVNTLSQYPTSPIREFQEDES